jgi:GntR family transcriptional regulator
VVLNCRRCWRGPTLTLAAPVNISIQRDSPVPIRDQIVEQIGLLIASGVLAGNQKLPSIRALAQKLGIHHGIVNSAYNQLSDLGLLQIRQGSGVKVVPKVAVAHEKGQASLESLFRYFLAQATDLGYSRAKIEQCIQRQLHRQPVKRILLVDNAPDFHAVALAELSPHFSMPIEAITHTGLKSKAQLIEDSIILTSIYHLTSLEDLPLDPTRFIVCNIEPAREELDLLRKLPKASIVVVVSKSSTLMNAGTRIAAAVRGDELALRSISLEDTNEIAYTMRFAKAAICDFPSKETVLKLAGKVPVRVFQIYSPSTIQLIKDRLAEWG